MVNTCTVTREADKDALRLIRRIARRNPTARLVVTGCLASRSPAEILAAAPAAVVVGNDGKDALPAMLGCSPAPGFAGITGFHRHSRAFVKIQDGCNMNCAYCVIPSVRPTLSCKPGAELEREVRDLVGSGIAEIVLCGIRLGRYLVRDASGRRVDFVGLLDRLLSLPGDFRIRLSSLEVTDLTDRFLELLPRWDGRLCPSFHVPLQSGSDAVLAGMKRWYSSGLYARRLEALRVRCPEAGLFTDAMAGFPGETEASFEESFRFIEGLGFSGLHVFRYSRRPGTPAARFKDQVPDEAILERSRRLHALDARLRAAFAARAVGAKRRVLVEPRPGGAEGLTEHFLRVRFDPGAGTPPGHGLVWAEITAARGTSAVARLAPGARPEGAEGRGARAAGGPRKPEGPIGGLGPGPLRPRINLPYTTSLERNE